MSHTTALIITLFLLAITGACGTIFLFLYLKRSKEALSLSLLRATLESTADGILVVDNTGKMVSFNRKFVEMWRIPESIIDSRDDNRALAFVLEQLEDPEGFLKKVRDLYDNHEAESYDTLEFKDGRVFERYSKPQKIGAKSIGRVWSFRDVTERHQAEEALRRRTDRIIHHQKALLKLAKMESSDLESSLKKITEVDSETLNVDRVSIWLFTEDRSEIICEDLYNLSAGVHEKGFHLKASDYPRYFQGLEENRTIAAGDARQDPLTREFTEGYLTPLGITSMMDVPIRRHGRVAGIVCHEHRGPKRDWTLEEQDFAASIADMVSLRLESSERRRVEEELARSNKELEQFAYIASHDLAEPLHTIVGFTNRLQTTSASLLGENERDYLERMQRAGLRMQKLIEDILLFSRVTTRAKPFGPVDLRDMIKEVVSDLEGRIAESGGRVEAFDLPTVFGDRHQLRQLFQNLVSNAFKFRQKETPPVVRIEGRSTDDGFAEITVEDNGIGFEEKFIDHIFEPFQRLHGWSQYDGSGIGLAICQKIVLRHGGRITAQSEPGKGSTFTVRLPIPLRKEDGHESR